MIFLNSAGDGLIYVVLLFVFMFYSPGIILLIVGLFKLRKNREAGKKLLIYALIYFVVGTGICVGLGGR